MQSMQALNAHCLSTRVYCAIFALLSPLFFFAPGASALPAGLAAAASAGCGSPAAVASPGSCEGSSGPRCARFAPAAAFGGPGFGPSASLEVRLRGVEICGENSSQWFDSRTVEFRAKYFAAKLQRVENRNISAEFECRPTLFRKFLTGESCPRYHSGHPETATMKDKIRRRSRSLTRAPHATKS